MALKTFLDSGVLLAAWRGGPSLQRQALSIMADEEREFLTAETVRLELLPKPTFEKRRVEVEFYNEHFNSAAGIEPFSQPLGDAAFNLARKYGLSAGDALNLARRRLRPTRSWREPTSIPFLIPFSTPRYIDSLRPEDERVRSPKS